MKSLSILLLAFSVFIISCDSDEPNLDIGSFIVVVDGDSLALQDGKVRIEINNGLIHGQDISASIGRNGMSNNNINISYRGELSADVSANSYDGFSLLYYENNYKDCWRACCGINLIITKMDYNRVWGYVEDVEVSGDLGVLKITGVKFEGIPIERVNIKLPKGPVP